jgi:hypothetical protein
VKKANHARDDNGKQSESKDGRTHKNVFL